MEIVAFHMARHIKECGETPFGVIFERLEAERQIMKAKQATCDRALAFLSQRATRPSHSKRVSNEEPAP